MSEALYLAFGIWYICRHTQQPDQLDTRGWYALPVVIPFIGLYGTWKLPHRGPARAPLFVAWSLVSVYSLLIVGMAIGAKKYPVPWFLAPLPFVLILGMVHTYVHRPSDLSTK